MTETTKIDYTNKELVAMILRDKGIYEGNWVFAAKLSFSAMNLQLPDSSDPTPAGVVGLAGVRIERVPEPLPFSINAAEVNPKKAKK